MSSPILPIQGPAGPSNEASTAPSGATPSGGPEVVDRGAFASELQASEGTLAVAAGSAGPPPEVLEHLAGAARIEEQLRASGRRLHFASTAPGERTRIEIHDRDGDAVRLLSVAEALEIAAGRPLG